MILRSSSAAWVTALGILSALLYFHGLGSSPPYLSIEEVSQARDAVAFAATGRDMDGRLLPLYFPEPGSPMGREPLFIYLSAALLQIVPFSEAAARAPSAAAGLLDVLLMFVVARNIFGRPALAATAAGLLMLTPVHFLQSRIGTQPIGTVTCVLGWLALLTAFLNTGRVRRLFAATVCLGVGMYTYNGGFLIMPVYFVLTLVVAWRRPVGDRKAALQAAIGGYLCVVLPLFVWYVIHPERITQLAGYYTHGEYNKDMGSTGFTGGGAIAHLDAWWQCFNPDKLFFSGDADLRFSTRGAGYFLLPLAVPMIAGVRHASRLLRTDVAFVVVVGLVLSPLPAAFVSNGDMKRWLPFLPFAIIVATAGIEFLRAGGRRVVEPCAIGILLIARWLTALASPLLLAAFVAQWTFAARRRAGYVCVAALTLLGALQMARYLSDYFGAYRIESSRYYGGNLRGAIRQAIATSAPGDCVRLDKRVYYLQDQWDLYTRAYNRLDLAQRTFWFDAAGGDEPPASCRGVTTVGDVDDTRFSTWRKTPIPELSGPVRLAVYRSDAP